MASVAGGMRAVVTVSELNDNPKPVDVASSGEILPMSTVSKSQIEPSRDQWSCSSGGRLMRDFMGVGGYSTGQMQSRYDGGISRGKMDSQGDW